MIKKTLIISCFFIWNSSFTQVCHGKKVMVTENGKKSLENYELVFEDDFKDPQLDLSKWLYTQPGSNHSIEGFNVSLEYQTDGLNYEFTNDILKLLVKDEKIYAKAVQSLDSNYLLKDGLPNLRWWDYTAGMIYSIPSFGFGKYEIRCKIPKGKGFWSVFWLYGKDDDEIDVFEFWYEDNMFGKYQEKRLSTVGHMTTHANKKMCETNYTGEDFSLDYHVFSVTYTNEKIEWYVDGIIKRTSYKFYTLLGQPISGEDIKAGQMYIMDKTYPLNELHISVSLGIQPGKKAPDAKTPFPSSLDVDYIRFYRWKE
ncbi:MAG: glycoside hydrolase family 16 protein [Bacteroidetes bacterium]|nr:glycoside hydrolase family 16 protein [Bacteroidota bacterium]